MDKIRIGDTIKTLSNGSDMVWEWTRTLIVDVNEEFDPLQNVNVFGCDGKPAEVTVESEGE